MKYALQKEEGFVRRAISVALISGIMLSTAQAAHLADVQGTVLVDYGLGFHAVAGNAALGPGDRVRAEHGSAVIVYDGCNAVPVAPGQTVAVVWNPPCSKMGFSEHSGTGFSELPASTYVLGGVAIAGGVGLAVALSSSSNGSPASP